MLPKLFLLFLSLAMGHFTDITSRQTRDDVSYHGSRKSFVLNRITDKNDAINYCANKCLEAKYFCKVFMVVSKAKSFVCEMFGKPISQLRVETHQQHSPLKIYQLSESVQVEPVEERFSHDHHPEPQWISHLADGYGLSLKEDGLSKVFLENVINGCTLAMTRESKQSTALAQDIKRAVSDLPEFSGHRILEGVQSPSFANVLFSFLDVFCPHIGQDITTIYDRKKNQLSIRGPNIRILVVAIGSSGYAIVRDAPSDPSVPLVYVSTRRRTETHDIDANDFDSDDDDFNDDDFNDVDSDDVDSDRDDVHDNVARKKRQRDDVDPDDVDPDDVDDIVARKKRRVDRDLFDPSFNDLYLDLIERGDVDLHDDFYSDDHYIDNHDVVSEADTIDYQSDTARDFDNTDYLDLVVRFEQAMNTKIQNVNVEYTPFGYFKDNDEDNLAIIILQYVLRTLLEPKTSSYPTRVTGVNLIFYQDLVTAVLSRVYAQIQSAAFRHKLHSEPAYNDISIIARH